MTIDTGLADLLVPHWSDGAGPRLGFSGTGSGVEYGQGTVVSWTVDGEQFRNVIRIDGTDIPDVPVIGSTDILVTRPGDQVAVMSWSPSGGAAVYWIIGRLVVPGTPAAARSIEFMRGNLAREVAVGVFSAQVFSADVDGGGTRASDTYGDPDSPGDPGPAVFDVPIVTGRAVVMLSSAIRFASVDGAANSFLSSGFLSYQVTGATTIDPDDITRSAAGTISLHGTGADSTDIGVRCTATLTRIVLEDGLNPGRHDFTVQYKRNPAAVDPFEFAARSLTVIAL